jgi:hypothetical protein
VSKEKGKLKANVKFDLETYGKDHDEEEYVSEDWDQEEMELAFKKSR